MFQKGGMNSISDMMRYTDMVDGFDGIDLAASAKRFLPHLQVPISNREREAAKRRVATQSARAQQQHFGDDAPPVRSRRHRKPPRNDPQWGDE